MVKIRLFSREKVTQNYIKLKNLNRDFLKEHSLQHTSNTVAHDYLHHAGFPIVLHQPSRIVIKKTGKTPSKKVFATIKPSKCIIKAMPPSVPCELKLNGYSFLENSKRLLGKIPSFKEYFTYMKKEGLNSSETKQKKRLAISDQTLRVWYLQSRQVVKAWFNHPDYPKEPPKHVKGPIKTVADDIRATAALVEFLPKFYPCTLPDTILRGEHMKAGTNLKKRSKSGSSVMS